ncbi:MAG: Zn-dependent hydrolase [Proteobacteria bacterium]|nr:Zn-dependent hydrolase [Pseudomonadota bacterium]
MTRMFTLAFAFLAVAAAAAQAGEFPAASPERMEARIKALAKFGANAAGGVDRVAYSPADIAGRAYIKGLMQELGLEVRIDSGGNIIGRRQGREPDLRSIMFGSHIDSVPGGGNYDGDVGVVSALEVIDLLNAAGHVTRHPLEVVVFSNEEGGLVGSLVMIGALKPAALDVVSHSGLTIRDGIDILGGDSERLAAAVVKPGALKAFIELHIEQGAILDEAEIEIGVVEGIVGIRWWDVTIDGFANHAGTTPMNRRRDALVAAARLTLAINQVALEMPGRQVATVGRIRAEPGAPNVIPGRVVMSLEVRDLELAKMEQVFAEIEMRAAKIADQTGTSIRFDLIDVDSHPEPTDPRLRRIIARAAQMYGYSYRLMPSGAGHDAQDLATITPTGMIFVPSRGGISHSPREFTSPRHMANGADVLLGTVLAIDQGALDN